MLMTTPRKSAGPWLRREIRADIDLRNEKINYKVREHSVAKTPVMFICGKREVEERTVNIRRLGSKEQQTLPLEAAIDQLVQESLAPDDHRISQSEAA